LHPHERLPFFFVSVGCFGSLSRFGRLLFEIDHGALSTLRIRRIPCSQFSNDGAWHGLNIQMFEPEHALLCRSRHSFSSFQPALLWMVLLKLSEVRCDLNILSTL
jgi:hypothetical protein